MWFQLQIEQCPCDAVEAITDCIENSSEVLALTLTDKHDSPVLEPLPGTTPLWPTVVIQALYADKAEGQAMQLQLATLYPQLQSTVTDIENQDWEKVGRDTFTPQLFGKRLWVCPSWLPVPEPSACNVILDPGLAFGTGTHPTTSLCLSWLDKTELHGKTVIDFGCGSGILSLAALKLGASRVYAVDIDPQALLATQNNAHTNHIQAEQLIIDYPSTLHQRVDILVANILLSPLLALQSDFYNLLKDQGIIVVSGILEEQTPEVIQAYQQHFTHLETQSVEGWSLLMFQLI